MMLTVNTMAAFRSLCLNLILFGHSFAVLVSSNEKSCDSADITLAPYTAPLVDGNLTTCISASHRITEASWVLTPKVNASLQVKVTTQGVNCSATNLEVFTDIGCMEGTPKQECLRASSVQEPSMHFSCFFNCSCALSCSRLYTRVYAEQDGGPVGLCEVSIHT